MVAAVAALVAGCTSLQQRTFEPGVETMPGYASVWLTSEPANPHVPVLVAMRSPDDPGLLFQHTFVAGVPLRGHFATSEGRYHLAALGGECSTDLLLGPSELAEVVLTLDGDAACTMRIARVRNMDEEEIDLDGLPAVLITNHGVGSETPFEEPRPAPP
jgi:hypothetical protein